MIGALCVAALLAAGCWAQTNTGAPVNPHSVILDANKDSSGSSVKSEGSDPTNDWARFVLQSLRQQQAQRQRSFGPQSLADQGDDDFGSSDFGTSPGGRPEDFLLQPGLFGALIGGVYRRLEERYQL